MGLESHIAEQPRNSNWNTDKIYIFILVSLFQSLHLTLPAKSRPWTRKCRAHAPPVLRAGPHGLPPGTTLDLSHRESDEILANLNLRLTQAGHLLEREPRGLTTDFLAFMGVPVLGLNLYCFIYLFPYQGSLLDIFSSHRVYACFPFSSKPSSP